MNKRIAYWDNFKFFLILAVVIGHFCEAYYGESTLLRCGYVFIYSFHMPAFLFVSGIFSKRTVNENNYKKILPYLTCFVFTMVLLFLTKELTGTPGGISLFNVGGVSWFMLSLFCMNLITMLIKDYKPTYMLILSLFIGVIIGFSAGENTVFLAWSRTVIFYPFFYLGYCFDPEKVISLTNKVSVKITAVITIIVLMAIILLFREDFSYLRPLLTGKYFYTKPYQWLLRIALYIVSFSLIFLISSLIPKKRLPLITAVGQRTLTVYSTHYCFVYLLCDKLNIEKLLSGILGSFTNIGIVLIAAAVTIICANGYFDFIVKKLYTLDWKLKNK